MLVMKKLSATLIILYATIQIFAIEHTYESIQYTGTVNLPLIEEFGKAENAEKLVNLSSGNLAIGMELGKLDIGNDSVYTIILGYNAGIPLNQQASWVGLGFNINPGAIIRSVKSLPDDAKRSAYQNGSLAWNGGMGIVKQFSGGLAYHVFVDKTTMPNSGVTIGPQGFQFYLNLNKSSFYPAVLPNGIVAVPPSSFGIAPGTGVAYGFSGPNGGGSISEIYYRYGMIWDNLTDRYREREYYSRNGLSQVTFYTGSPPHPSSTDEDHSVFRTLNNVISGTTTPSFAFGISEDAHDNYLVQGPAPTGVMFYDNTCQLQLGAGPWYHVLPSPCDSNPPSYFDSCGQKGFFYVARHSLNIGYEADSEKEQQGVKIIHETDSAGRISKIIITDMDGIKYYYAKQIRVHDVRNYASHGKFQYTYTDDFNGYATSWLLTAIVYPDFIDNGTQFTGLNYDALKETTDKGGYVAFLYTDVYFDFEYRSPNVDSNVTFPYSSSCPPIRDTTASIFAYSNSMGKITYPYLSKIETPKMWADFTISDRFDAIETFTYPRSPSGKTSQRKLKKLNNIKIFSKITDTLIRQIDFNYDYSLAKGSYLCSIENPSKGRLTLKDVTITNKGKTYPRVLFNYSFNPICENDSIVYGQSILWDRWGYYKSDAQWDHSNGIWKHFTTSTTDAAAWSLTSIKTPLGLEVGIEYESDDYGYVGNYKPLGKRGTATRYGSSQFNNWDTVAYKLGPDIRVKKIDLKGPNTKTNTLQFIYSSNVNDKISVRNNSSGVVTDESPSFSRPEDVDYNDIDYGYYQPWRCNIGQRYAPHDNYGFKHVYETVQVYYPDGKYKTIYKYLPPKGLYRPWAYKYSLTEPPALWNSWIIDYRPTLAVGAISEVRNYCENTNNKFKEISSIVYDYFLDVNNKPYDDLRYYKTSYTSITHRTKFMERRPNSIGSWNYSGGENSSDTWGCRCLCNYPPCYFGSDTCCDFDWGSSIYYGSVVLAGWTEKKDGISIKYSQAPYILNIVGGIDRLTGLSLSKTVNGGDLPIKKTNYVLSRDTFFVNKNILKKIKEEKTFKNNSLNTHKISEFGGPAYGDNFHGTILPRKIGEKILCKELDNGVAFGAINDSDYTSQFTVTIFDEYGKQEEVKDVRNMYSLNIYDHFPKGGSDKTKVFPNKIIAKVKNARFFESGVYTCDYNANPGTNYLDKSNGWEQGQYNDSGFSSPEVIIISTPTHFGTKCIKVKHAYGPNRNFKLFKDSNGRIRDYILSARIKTSGVPLQKNMVMGADYRKIDTSTTFWPIDLVSATKETPVPVSGQMKVVPKADGWNYVELSIPASKDLASFNWNDGWGVHLWVGAPNGPAGSFIYIDDIRFYPTNALVTTNYYDVFRDNVIAEVDPNGIAKYYEYDSFDRLECVKNNEKQMIKSFSYHLMGLN